MRPMRDKIVITCAVTGNLTTPDQTPHLPITPEQIAEALCALHADPLRRSEIGLESVAWFATHQGQALARRWLEQMAA